MSRLNPQRSVGGEDNLARRIERERTARGLSYEALAKLLTEAGCTIQGSAIYKIEKTKPPRRITVDELIALAQVLETSIEDLLTPIEVLEKERAQEVLKDLDKADGELLAAMGRFLTAYRELRSLAASDPELFEYVKGHHDRATPTRLENIMVKDDIYNFALYDAYNDVYPVLLQSAEQYHSWSEQAAEAEGTQAQQATERNGELVEGGS